MSFIEWGGDAPENATPALGSDNYARFKGKKGETYRLSFAWWPQGEEGKLNLDAKKPRFIGGKRIYVPNVGYVLYKGPEYNGLGDKEPKIAIGTIVIQWPTDKAGNVVQDRLFAGDYKVASWVFPEQKYKVLENNWRDWPASEHDVTVLCEDEQFQKMTFSPCKNNLLRQLIMANTDKSKPIVADIMAKIKSVEARLANEVAKDLSVADIKLKLGKLNDSPVASPSGLSNQVDNMLDSILDD